MKNKLGKILTKRIAFALIAFLSLANLLRAQSPAAAPPTKKTTVPSTATTHTPASHAEDADTPNDSDPAKTVVVSPRVNVDMLAAIKKSGKLRVGVAEIIPWAMHDKNGNFVGFEIDVAKKLARDMGVEVEFYPVEFRYLIPDLLAGRTDIIISGLSIRASRALELNFSEPYNQTDVLLAVTAKNASPSMKVDSFNKENFTIGVLEGTTAEQTASVVLPNALIHAYSADSSMINDLVEGKIDGAVADSPRPELLGKIFPGKVVALSGEPLATFPAGFGVRRGDMDFVNFLNSWIESRKANKWLESRRSYWFKNSDWLDTL
jgi:polar amino acid transport system substrate-binding protein